MAEGRDRAGWRMTSAVMALIANVNRDPKGKAFEPSDFDPYHERTSKAVHVMAGTMADFRKAFKGK